MISQDTKDQIEKDALVEFPERLIGTHTGSVYDQNEHDRAIWKEGATKYAEKLEDLKERLDNQHYLRVSREAADKLVIESKDRELAQLKEIAENMAGALSEAQLWPNTSGEVIKNALIEYRNSKNNGAAL